MIDKIHFSLNIFIYVINTLICILFYTVRSVNLEGTNISKDIIAQIENTNQISLASSIFLLVYSLVFITIYQEVYKKDILKDLFINLFYILSIISIMFNNYQIFDWVQGGDKDLSLILFDIPTIDLDKINYIYHYTEGFFLLLIILAIFKTLISFYRIAKNFLINYFQSGRNICYFEISHILS